MNQVAPKWSLDDAVEIKFDNRENFSIIAESLTRIGIPNNNKRELKQIAHILHKRGKYYIIHYKGMYALDNDYSYEFDIEDLEAQNKIAKLIETWGLAEIVDKHKVEQTNDVFVKVIKGSPEKETWDLIPQYVFGNN